MELSPMELAFKLELSHVLERLKELEEVPESFNLSEKQAVEIAEGLANDEWLFDQIWECMSDELKNVANG